MEKGKTVYHLRIFKNDVNKYYTSLRALVLDGLNIGVSRSYLEKRSWATPFKNEICTIIKSKIKTKTQL